MKRAVSKLVLAIVISLIPASHSQTLSGFRGQPLLEPGAATPEVPTVVSASQANYKPKNGYVPNEETAIAIAVAVWTPIYGKATIAGEKPYKATLKNGVWIVTGSLPEGYVGGTAEASISRDTGCILRVIHSK